MNKKILFVFIYIFSAVLLIANNNSDYYNSEYFNSLRDTVGNEIFLQGNYVEVGIHNCASYGTQNNAPAGYHPRMGRLGFVADFQKDGWDVGTPPYSGDFFVPGTPEEGWMVEWTINRAEYNFGNFGLMGLHQIPTEELYETSTGSIKSAFWSGEIHNGNNGSLRIEKDIFFHTDNLFFTMDVTMTNIGDIPLESLEYMRNVDPDNEQNITGNFHTYNYVLYQPDAINDTALVIAEGATYTITLGLGTIDERAVVSTEGFSNRDPDAILDSPVAPPQSNPIYADIAIVLAYRFGTVDPGQSVHFKYVYILDASEIGTALQSLANVHILQPGDVVCGPEILFEATTDDIAHTSQITFFIDDVLLATDTTCEGPDSTFSTTFNSLLYEDGFHILRVEAIVDSDLISNIKIIEIRNNPELSVEGDFILDEDTFTILTLTAEDCYSDSIEWSFTDPEHGDIEETGGDRFTVDKEITYIPDPDYFGDDTFEIIITNENGKTDSVIVDLIIEPVNDPPVNTVTPPIYGNFIVGYEIYCDPGEWNDDIDVQYAPPEFQSQIDYSYQWQVFDNGNWVDIPNETDTLYVIGSEACSGTVRCVVTAEDNGIPGNETATAASDEELVESVYLDVTPTSLHETLEIGETSTRILHVENVYEIDIDYNVGIFYTVEEIESNRIDLNLDNLPRCSEPATGKYVHREKPISNPIRETTLTRPADDTLKVLIYASDNNTTGAEEAKTQLIATGLFADENIDIALDGDFRFEYSDIQQYKAILVWSNYSFNNPANVGNVLKEYVDNGGGVILSTYCYSTPWAIQGGILDPGYSPFIPDFTQNVSGTLDMGSITDPGHPVFNGIIAAPDYWFNSNYSNPDLNIDGILLAQDTNGNNVVAISPNQKVVGINIYPGFLADANMETARLFANALVHVSGVEWLSVDPEFGTVPGLTTVDIEVYFDTAGLLPGTYDAEIVIIGPCERDTIPVTLEIIAPGGLNIEIIGGILQYTDEDVFLDIVANVTYPDNSLLYWFLINLGGMGTYEFVDEEGRAEEERIIRYTPYLNYNGYESFGLYVQDSWGQTAYQTICVVVNPWNDSPVNTIPPIIEGNFIVGEEITCDPGEWNDDADNQYVQPGYESTITISYQWQHSENDSTDWICILDATESSYVLQESDANKYIRCMVIAVDDGVGLGGETTTIAYSNTEFCSENTGDNEDNIVYKTALIGAYPNPFNPSVAGRSPDTNIQFSLKEKSSVKLEIYNLKGQLVKSLHEGLLNAGFHNIAWNGKDNCGSYCASGLYLYILKVESKKFIKKLMLIK